MSRKHNEVTRSRSTERSSTVAPTAPVAPRIPSVVVQIPCAAARVQSWTSNSQGGRKMGKTEKEKTEKEKTENLWVPRMHLLVAMGHLWVPRTLCCFQSM